jgi:hypothetical protein
MATSSLARVNLNLPEDARARLQALASQAGVTEGELARKLMLAAIERAERHALRRQLRALYADGELAARDVKIATAMEELRGKAR